MIQNRRPLANEGKKQEKNGIWIEKEMNGITPERQGVMRQGLRNQKKRGTEETKSERNQVSVSSCVEGRVQRFCMDSFNRL